MEVIGVIFMIKLLVCSMIISLSSLMTSLRSCCFAAGKYSCCFVAGKVFVVSLLGTFFVVLIGEVINVRSNVW